MRQDLVLLLVLLIHRVGKLNTLRDQVLASLAQLLVLYLERLADLKQVQALLLPNRRHRRIITLQHLQLQLHLFHLFNDLLCFDLLLDQLVLDLIHLFRLSVLVQLHLLCVIGGYGL